MNKHGTLAFFSGLISSDLGNLGPNGIDFFSFFIIWMAQYPANQIYGKFIALMGIVRKLQFEEDLLYSGWQRKGFRVPRFQDRKSKTLGLYYITS